MNRIGTHSGQKILAAALLSLVLSSWVEAQSYSADDLPPPEPDTTQTAEPAPDQAALESAAMAAQVMAELMQAYKQCVKAIIASAIDSPVEGKFGQIQTQCQLQRQAIAEVLPEDLREYLLTNVDRRGAWVLQGMQKAEAVVADTAEDTRQAIDERAGDSDGE